MLINQSKGGIMFTKTVLPIFSLIVIVFLTCLTLPTYAVIGAIEDGLVAYWSFDRDTVQIQKQAEDIFSGLKAVVKGDPELAAADNCKVGECVLFDGDVDYFLVEDSAPAKIDRDWNEITLECWVFI